MVLTPQQRRPWLYDEDGQKKPSHYMCENCGLTVEVGRFPRGWIAGFATSWCSHKCYSEHMDKVIAK